MSNRKHPWPLGGYAPGHYNCKCNGCGTTFVGDKRAYECLECAAHAAAVELKKRYAEIGLLRSALLPFKTRIEERRARHGPQGENRANEVEIMVRLDLLLAAEKVLNETND